MYKVLWKKIIIQKRAGSKLKASELQNTLLYCLNIEQFLIQEVPLIIFKKS